MQATHAAAQAQTADRLAALMRHLMAVSGSDFFQAIDDLGLSLSQIKLMNLLWDEGELALKELSERLALSLPAVSRAVDGLVRRRLVTRSEDPGDRRMKRIAITRKGRDLSQRLIEMRFADLGDFVAGLSERERVALDRALTLICEGKDLR